MPEAAHEITVNAPATEVYRLVADVTNWPRMFPPTVHVEHVGRDGNRERIRIWATANGEAKTWTSRRELYPARLRIDFQQEVSQPPVGAMGGSWVIEPLADRGCRVRLHHAYRAVDDDPAKLDWIARAVDRNSDAELAALKASAERATEAVTFDDVVEMAVPAKDVYDFLNEAGLWAQRLPHVARSTVREDSPGLQILEMDTTTKDGSTHTTTSVRVCVPYRQIVYKQIVLPALMNVHTGHWLLADTPHGVTVTSRHTVVINEANVGSVLGADADVARAAVFVREALSANSLATLARAEEYARQLRGS